MNDYYLLSIVDIDNNSNNVLKYKKIKKDELSNDDEFLNEIEKSLNTLLITESGKLCTIYDKENNKEYLAVSTINYGYFVLLEDNKLAILNRDKEE